MPVYNAEAYLQTSVSSVLAQNCDDFELICFNDASTDASLSMLRSFEQSDSRVRIIDSAVNIKQGGGRNRALAAARGRFVLFLDADDALAPSAISQCLSAAEAHDADMVLFDYARVAPATGTRTEVCHLGADAAAMRGDQLRRRIISRPTPVWSAMYRRELITDNGLFFPEGVFYEDNAVAMAMQLSARNPVKINAPLYLYRCDNASVSRSRNDYRFFHRIASATTLLSHLRRLGIYQHFAQELDELFLNQYLTHTVYGCIYRFNRVPLSRLRYVERTVGRHIGHWQDNPVYRSWPRRQRLKLALHLRFPLLLHTLSRLKHILLNH